MFASHSPLINKGTSIIFVSHNLIWFSFACNTAIYLQHGQVKHSGAVKDVVDRYEQDSSGACQKFDGSYATGIDERKTLK
jgi:ABC-type polysaccharide/polyol phosphate transport system ATPase subunit